MPVRKPINVRKEPKLKKGKVKQSKRVTDRVKATGALMGRIRSLSAKAAAGFEDKLAAELRDGEVMPDQKLALTLVGRSVKTALGLLEKADNVYCGKAVSRRFLSDACIHTASHEIYPELVDVRRAIDRRFGNEAGRQIHGMEGHTLRKPKRQHPQLKSLVKTLESWRGIPKPLRPGPPGEREHWLAQLEPGYKKLTQMLSELEKHEMQEERLRHDRDFELECFDVAYGEALALVRAVFRLGGRGEKAVWQLLPTVQRRRLKGKARQESEARAEGLRKDDA